MHINVYTLLLLHNSPSIYVISGVFLRWGHNRIFSSSDGKLSLLCIVSRWPSRFIKVAQLHQCISWDCNEDPIIKRIIVNDWTISVIVTIILATLRQNYDLVTFSYVCSLRFPRPIQRESWQLRLICPYRRPTAQYQPFETNTTALFV